jgi:dual specificity MAP kinase phosphatase
MLPLATPQTASSVALNGLDSERTTPIQIPNKHMPSPNPGGIKFMCPVTPPASPPDGPQVSDIKQCMESLLHPPDGYARLSEEPTVYAIDAPGLAAAVNFTARQPLPDIEQLFPWAHGLHPENVMQLSFFFAKKKSARRVPTCYRGLCIVKVGRDYTKARLKGSILPEEILSANPRAQGFLSVDPREGFNVRNFHIQVGKFAGLSDIVVYGDDETNENEVLVVARRISEAQEHYRMQCQGSSARPFPLYCTFVVKSELPLPDCGLVVTQVNTF